MRAMLGACGFCLLIAALLLSACADSDDDDAADADDDGDDDADDDDTDADELRLFALDPTFGGCSAQTVVTLNGSGFGLGLSVLVGDAFATDVQVVSANEARAVFPVVGFDEAGPRDVKVLLGAAGHTLFNAFEYRFDEDPVLFVHGFFGNASDFNKMRERFIELGYPEQYLLAVDFDDNMGSTIPQAQDELPAAARELLDRSGAERVDVVAHSMGAISTRLWIKLYGGQLLVRDVVFLAGANHGTTTACMGQWMGEGSEEMCPCYASEEDSHNLVQWTLNGDPNSADVDETPFGVEEGGEVHWQGALYSNVDLVILPPESGCLNQGYRNDCSHPINRLVPGVGHIGMPSDPEVFEIVQGLLREHRQGNEE